MYIHGLKMSLNLGGKNPILFRGKFVSMGVPNVSTGMTLVHNSIRIHGDRMG